VSGQTSFYVLDLGPAFHDLQGNCFGDGFGLAGETPALPGLIFLVTGPFSAMLSSGFHSFGRGSD